MNMEQSSDFSEEQTELFWEAIRLKEELETQLNKNQINEDTYNISIVDLCYRYILKGLADYSVNLLLYTKPDYFNNNAIKHMKEDQIFYDKCMFIFEILNHLGYIPSNAFVNQGEAKA
jgi:hypothetical protein